MAWNKFSLQESVPLDLRALTFTKSSWMWIRKFTSSLIRRLSDDSWRQLCPMPLTWKVLAKESSIGSWRRLQMSIAPRGILVILVRWLAGWYVFHSTVDASNSRPPPDACWCEDEDVRRVLLKMLLARGALLAGELTFVWIWSIPTFQRETQLPSCGWQRDLLHVWASGIALRQP